MADAHHLATHGLLSGRGVTAANLIAIGRRFLADLVEPFEARFTPD